MKILALWRLKPDADLEAIQSLLIDEERFAWNAYLSGDLREHYESDMPTPAISILEADSVDDARKRLEDLPLLQAGLISGDFYPLRPFKNWQVLFRDEERDDQRDTPTETD